MIFFRALRISLIGLLLILGGCNKKTHPQVSPAATFPTAPNYFQLAERSFDSGYYEEAAHNYDQYLQDNPNASNSDVALLHSALSSAILDQMDEATEKLERLVAQFPDSPLSRQGKIILSFQADVKELETSIGKKENEKKVNSETITHLLDQVEKLQADKVKLESQVKEKEERLQNRDTRIKESELQIQLLTEELEKLKRIDMERLPSRPPD